MEKDFFTALEVAARLRVELKTLQNRATGHEVYRPCQRGRYHRSHVDVLVKVWARALTPEEGLAVWMHEKDRMRPPSATPEPSKERVKKSKDQG